MAINNSPFDDAVVPVPSGAPAGGGITGGLPMPDAGSDPVSWAFQDRACPTPGTQETSNASGLTRVDQVGIDGSGVRERNMDLETPSKNLAGGN